MRCSKCGQDNPEQVQFCLRCHAPLRFTCPGCQHLQDHGDQCDQCGLNFGKYTTMLLLQAQTEAQSEHKRLLRRNSILKQIVLLPITGGLSLFGLLRSLFKRD